MHARPIKTHQAQAIQSHEMQINRGGIVALHDTGSGVGVVCHYHVRLVWGDHLPDPGTSGRYRPRQLGTHGITSARPRQVITLQR